VHGAGHLFEEPGALDRVADLAAGWFTRHLAPDETAARAPGVEPVISSGGVDVTREK
jgi:hypothetical protein